jgi:hypothetical protein
MFEPLPKATVKIFDGKVYVEVPPDRDTPYRLKPINGRLSRVGRARNYKLASHVWGLRSAAPALPSQPRTSPMRARAPRPRQHRGVARGRDGGARDDGSASADDGGGGSADPPPRSEGGPRAAVIPPRSRAPRVIHGRARQ